MGTIDSHVDSLNFTFKFLHSCERNSGLDDKRFARPSIALVLSIAKISLSSSYILTKGTLVEMTSVLHDLA